MTFRPLPWSVEQDEMIWNMREAGATHGEIGRKLDRSADAVRDRLNRLAQRAKYAKREETIATIERRCQCCPAKFISERGRKDLLCPSCVAKGAYVPSVDRMSMCGCAAAMCAA